MKYLSSWCGWEKLLTIGLLSCLICEAALPKGWVMGAKARKSHGNYGVQVNTREGVDILLESKKGHRQAVLSISDRTVTGHELRKGNRLPLRERVTYEASGKASGAMDVLVKVRDFEWSVYIDGTLRKVFAAPFVLPGTIAHRQDQASHLIGKGKFWNAPAAHFITNFMIEPGAKNELHPWKIQTGRWHLHTALEQSRIRPETSQGDLKRAPLTADKSPNFYSLKGGGKNQDCVITTGYEVYDDYLMTGSMQLTTGEAGLIIFHRDEDVPEGKKPDPAKAEFYAFTLRKNVPAKGMNDVRLWRQEGGKRQVLARAQVPLLDNQWTLPGIAAHGDEIVCTVDGWEVFRHRAPLTVGGKFGLYVKSPEEIRMDDVTVKPFEDIHLETLSGLRFHTEVVRGTAMVNGQPWEKASGEEKSQVLLGGKEPSTLLISRPHVKGRVFSVGVKPEGSDWALGLQAGWQGEGKPGYLFSVERMGASETYVLKDGQGKALETLTVGKPLAGDGEFELMADATSAGLLKFLKGGRVIFIQEVPRDFGGCVGVHVAAGSRALFRKFSLADERSEFKELEQKNPIFKKDSYMRHWASPEGQWIAGPGGAMWHKGDFFGDFYLRMPCIPGSVVNLGVADGKQEGPVSLSIEGKELVVRIKQPLQKALVERRIGLTPPEGKGVDALNYELNCEGLCLWVQVAGKRVAYEHLLGDLRKSGTRVCSKGLNLNHLSRTKVTRSKVIDEFFNESPFMWTANGGDWQIINRFQCTPSWSHMIAQSLDNMGAFWRKQIFKGDLTLEFYAGTRHGYYNTMGNLNCTVMAQTSSPSSGYTVTCTEWDQNLSQNWSRFYKNGKKLKETDAYLVPRHRKGMYRRIMNPLIAGGRPYHGAWYYIKLRKIGDKLEYYFDDELVMTQRDPQMIQEGLVGIWTFMHSMTLAQIKITYDEVSPRPVPVKQLPLTEDTPAKTAQMTYGTTVNGWPADAMGDSHWQVEDSVGQSRLTSFRTSRGTGQLLVNQLGAGSMMMKAKLPALPLHEVAGWTFLVKRTEQAQFNVFYEILNKDNKVMQRLFHRISGDDFAYGQWAKAGESKVPGRIVISPEDRDWTRVTVWIPTAVRWPSDAKSGRKVRLGGFGIEQEDFLRSGIGGNVPGEGYAVAGMTVIRYDAPVILAGKNEFIGGFADVSGKQALSEKTATDVSRALAATGKIGLNKALVHVTKQGKAVSQEVWWIQESEEVPVSLTWDTTLGDCLRLSMTSPYPHRGFIYPRLWLGKEKLTLREHKRGDDLSCHDFLVPLPRTQSLTDKLALTIRTRVPKQVVTVNLSLSDANRVNLGPVLMTMNGLTPYYRGFEQDGDLNKKRRQWRDTGDRFLESRNHYYGQRLSTILPTGFSVASYPVAQFFYKASDMANVSLEFDYWENAYVRLSDQETSRSHSVRHGKNMITDDTWRLWTGIVTDAFRGNAWQMTKFNKSRLCFVSVEGNDQTGRYSSLSLDDLVFGPAVRSDEQLAFVPSFFDADGVKAVQVARLIGPTAYVNLPEDKRKALTWVSYKPGERVKPSLNGLPDGLHHLAIRGIDMKGKMGKVVDVPILVDRKPLAFRHSLVKSSRPLGNGVELHVQGSVAYGAPWRSDKATFHVGKGAKAQALNGWQSNFIHQAQTVTMNINYPFIFRDLLNKSKDGDVLELGIDGIEDGAGNKTPKVTIPIKVDYKSDKQGPAWYSMSFPHSVGKVYNWDGSKANQTMFAFGSGNQGSILHCFNLSPHLQNRTYYANGFTGIGGWKWKPSRHPYLAFRASRNVIRPKTAVNLVLTLDKPVNGLKEYCISLTVPRKGKKELNRTQTFAWKANVPHPFLFNIPELMKAAGIAQKDIDAMIIQHVGFHRREAVHLDMLSLDDIVTFGAPDDLKKPDMLTWTGYDASGIASLEAECVDDKGKTLFVHSFQSTSEADLNQLRNRFEGVRWFKWYAKDKAGNASVPFWMPVVAPAKPKPTAEPAVKPVAKPAVKPAVKPVKK